MPLHDGQTFAGYTIVQLLGVGGMGEVYLAQHPRLPRRDALKILPGGISADPEFRRRFELEADLASKLWHPHIVGVHDRGEVDGQLWISMDFVNGRDASRLLREQYPEGMPAAEVVEIVTALASALDYAHDQGLVHRDVKPANIILANPGNDGDRRILLADFGVARTMDAVSGLTATNMTVGTVAYCAPEQLMGSSVDGRADQYALAATAYELLTGSTVFPNSNAAVVISQHLNAEPPTLSTRKPHLAAADAVFAAAMSKNPSHRFSRCSDFANALAEQLDLSRSQSAKATASASGIARGANMAEIRKSGTLEGWKPPFQFAEHQPPETPVPGKQRNTVGLIALIVGVVGFVFACIPGALIVGWVLLPIAFILSVVGLCLSGKTKSTSIAASIISIVGTVVGFTVFSSVVADSFADAFEGSDMSATPATSGSGAANNHEDAGSRTNPLPLGETVSNRDWKVTLGVPREAGAEVAAENPFNDPPEPGMEYWMVPVTATYTGSDTGHAGFGITVAFVGADNRTYSDRCGVIPDDISDVGALYKGGEAKGNVCVAIPAGADGLWSVSTGFVGQPVFFAAR